MMCDYCFTSATASTASAIAAGMLIVVMPMAKPMVNPANAFIVVPLNYQLNQQARNQSLSRHRDGYQSSNHQGHVH